MKFKKKKRCEKYFHSIFVTFYHPLLNYLLLDLKSKLKVSYSVLFVSKYNKKI